MKKYVAGLLTGIFIMSTMMVFAESTQTIQAIFGRVKLVVDGKALPDETLLYDGTTYVPLRAAAEALGVEVGWDGATNTARLTSKGGSVVVAPTAAVAPTPTIAPVVVTQAIKDLEIVEFGYNITGRSGSYLYYSIILRNPNSFVVKYPTYNITAYDANGKVLGTSKGVRGLIYPNGELVFAGQAFSVSEIPAKVDAEVQPIDEHNKVTIFDPFIPFEIEGAYQSDRNNILGQVVNPNNKAFNNVFVVALFRDTGGKLIGGDFTHVSSLPANGKIAFDINIGSRFENAHAFEVYAHYE